jgi:hypothetical protein
VDQRNDKPPATLTAAFPAWHFWLGVSGIKYARRPMSSPPKVVRAPTWELLRKELEAVQ